MKIKLGELKSIEESLKKLITMSLPIRIAYNLSKTLKKVSDELALFEEQKNNLIRKYGSEDEEKKVIEVKDPEKMVNFAKEINELLGVEMDLEFTPIDISLLEGKELSAADMINLNMFFTCEDDIS